MTTSVPRPLRRDARQNRAAIVLAAAEILRADPEAGVDTIAARAGLTRRAVYGHFPSRDELVEEVFVTGAARIAAALLPINDEDPRIAIATIGARLWREVAHVRTTVRLAVRGPHRSRVAEVLTPLREVLLREVELGVASGVFRQDIQAVTLARLIEGTALAVLDVASESELSVADGERLVIISVLSTAGLGWEQAARVGDLVATP